MELNIALELLPPKMCCTKDTRQLLSCHMFGYLLIGMLMISYPSAVYSQHVIEFSVLEELPVNFTVGNIINAAQLHNKYDLNVLSNLQFQILTKTSVVKDNFQIAPDTPNIVTKSVIDRDSVCAFMDTCDIYLDIGVQPTQYFEIIKCVIHIIDINDHAPVFPSDTESVYISESALPGALFPIPAAEDLDAGNYGIESFKLLNFKSKFEIRVAKSADGTMDLSLMLKTGLDREQNGFYSLIITAQDGGTPPKTGSVTVEVTVLDSNDNSPRFENSVYEVYIYENEHIGTSIVQMKANDIDEGLHGEIQYEFSRQSQAQFGDTFQINRLTGEVTTRDFIDYEERQNYSLRVVAKDNGPSSMAGFSQLIIRVRDINDNSPVITVNALSSSGYAEVSENKPVDEFVAHISVTDPDGGANGQVLCNINKSNFKLIQLYAKEFKIVTNDVFDREMKADYDVKVTCSDKGSNQRVSVESINITIVDDNDHAPMFQQQLYKVKVLENSGTGIKVLTINTTDLDIGVNGEVEYNIYSVGLYGDNILEIDPRSGDVFVVTSLNYEMQSEYYYQIIANDKGEPSLSSTASLTLIVEDVNDEVPTFSQPKFVFTVKEDIPVGTKVGTIMAYDLDSPPFNKISYSLIAIGGESKFTVDPKSGDIISIVSLDKELMSSRQSYELMVTASNRGFGLQNSVEVSIYVDDVNDNPPIVLFPSHINSSIQVSSSASEGDFVTQVRASDPDMGKNAALIYAIVPSGNELFHILADTGKVYASKSLRNFGGKEVKLLIEVSDRGEPSLSVKTELNIVINATLMEGKALVRDLSFVIAVVVTSIVLVAFAVVIFAIFLIRRRKKQALKKKVMYSCTVENRDDGNDGGVTGDDKMLPTISGTITSTDNNKNNWPDVIHVNQILGDRTGKNNKRRSSIQKDSNNKKCEANNQLNNKRVHFKESLESVCDNKVKAFPGQPQHQAGCSKSSPVFREESRHKLLYGTSGTQPPYFTSQNLQAFSNNHRDEDSSSDQGSSIDSGRGPSEEEQDHNRSGHSQQSLSSDVGLPPRTDLPKVHNSNNDNEYICMNQAQKIRDSRKASRSNSDNNYYPKDRYSPSGERLPTLPPRKSKKSLLEPPSYHSSNHVGRLASASSPEITLDKHEPVFGGNVNSPVTPSSDINGKNIGKYNCRNTGGVPTRSPNPMSGRCEHNVVGHFTELCQHGKKQQQRQQPSGDHHHWSGFDYPSNSGPDTASEGGSSTSGSYLVDHVDLGAEMSNDVFV